MVSDMAAPAALLARETREASYTLRWIASGCSASLADIGVRFLLTLRACVKFGTTRAVQLYAPHGYAHSLACDPIEKKPFFLECDLHCPFRQNWVSSQALRDTRSTLEFQTVNRRSSRCFAPAGPGQFC
jgi:hypothetical protein